MEYKVDWLDKKEFAEMIARYVGFDPGQVSMIYLEITNLGVCVHWWDCGFTAKEYCDLDAFDCSHKFVIDLCAALDVDPGVTEKIEIILDVINPSRVDMTCNITQFSQNKLLSLNWADAFKERTLKRHGEFGDSLAQHKEKSELDSVVVDNFDEVNLKILLGHNHIDTRTVSNLNFVFPPISDSAELHKVYDMGYSTTEFIDDDFSKNLIELLDLSSHCVYSVCITIDKNRLSVFATVKKEQ